MILTLKTQSPAFAVGKSMARPKRPEKSRGEIRTSPNKGRVLSPMGFGSEKPKETTGKPTT